MIDIAELRRRIVFQDTLGGVVRVPDWLPRSYEIFRDRLLDKAYPCYLGSAAEKQGDLLLTYTEGNDCDHLPSTLSTFLALSAANPERLHILAIFYEPEKEPQSHEYYAAQFWDLLQFLHTKDPHPWPAEYPTDPQDPLWEFTFDRTPAFVFATAPSYQHRKSRNLGPGMIVLFQPRRVFHGIEGNTPAGMKTRKIIRRRLEAWDSMAPHPDLGSFGDPSNHEWKQYFLPDENTPILGQCPLTIKGFTTDQDRLEEVLLRFRV